MSKTATTKCGKCDGEGYLNAFTGIDNGKCYGCMGSGTVKYQPMSVRKGAKCAASYDLSGLTRDDLGQPTTVDYSCDWAKSMIKRAAKNMLLAQDTAWARKELDECPAELRALLIAEGRALKAAS